MKFRLIDRVLEREESRLVALKQVSAAEEYLQDHFPTFPVLPGVMMLEAMVQAARELLDPAGSASPPLVLGQVRALKYGHFAKPGDALRVEVDLVGESDGTYDLRGACYLMAGGARNKEPLPTACAGKLTMRPARIAAAMVSDGSAVSAASVGG